VAGAATLLIAYALGVTDPAVFMALGVIVGFVPAAITWAVVNLRKARTP
jgi:type II secretory pathway component PulF